MTNSFVEVRPIENSLEVFKNFRRNILHAVESEEFENILDGMVFYDDSGLPVEIEVRLNVVQPLSKAIRQATKLMRVAAEASNLHIVDGEDIDEGGVGAYAEEGSHLVSA